MSQQEEDPSHYTRTPVVKPALSQMYDQLLPKSKSLETACKDHCTHSSAPRHVSVPRFRNLSDCSKQSRFYLPDNNGDLHAEQSILVMVRPKLEFYFKALARWSAEEPSIVVAIGTSCLRWSMVQKRKKHKEVNVWLCEVPPLHHPQNQWVLKNLFPRPDVDPVLHFAVFMYVDVQLLVGQAAARGQRRNQSSHPWHFWCWSPRRNELDCINLVHWREALCDSSSRDAIFVVGTVRKALWRWVYPRSRKRDHFQTLATGIRKLKM